MKIWKSAKCVLHHNEIAIYRTNSNQNERFAILKRSYGNSCVHDSVSVFKFVKVCVSKIDLAVKKVKVILGSSFYQTMMGWSPKCYISSFKKIGLPVLEKKIFECFLPYMDVAAILVM